MEDLVYRAVSIKTQVVESDPFEKGERKKLNFGHTIGHAIENNSDLTHGEAVSVGMNLACQISQELCELSDANAKKVNDLLQKFELPLKHDVPADIINQYLIKDKKKNRSTIDFILLKKIGEATIVSLPIEELKTKVIALCANPK
jgi:3-dehydroquinate synthase